MKQNSRNVIQICGKVLIGFFLVTILLAISPIGFLYLVFGYEKVAIRHAIDNPYVNDRYSGWYIVDIDEQNSFRLPEKWFLSVDNDYYKIFDEENNLWAVGAKFNTNNDTCMSHRSFLTSYLQKNIHTISYDELEESPNFVYMDGSTGGILSVTADQEELYYYMRLSSDTQEEFFWIILEDLNKNENLPDIIEAITYSYEYG